MTVLSEHCGVVSHFLALSSPSVHASHEETLRGAYKEVKIKLASVRSQGFGNMREITEVIDKSKTIRMQADTNSERATGTVEDNLEQNAEVKHD